MSLGTSLSLGGPGFFTEAANKTAPDRVYSLAQAVLARIDAVGNASRALAQQCSGTGILPEKYPALLFQNGNVGKLVEEGQL